MRLAVALIAAAAVALGALPRILLAAGALPDVLRPFVWSDAYLVYERSLAGHRLPYLDAPFEYPPLIGAVSGVFSLVAPGAAVFVTLWAGVQAACAALAAWLLMDLAEPLRVRRRFALAPQLVLLGSLNFDLVAVAFVSLALVAVRARRDSRTIAALALGTASKLFPLAVAPVAVLRAARPLRVALIGAAVLAACYLPAILAGPTAAAAPLYYLAGIDANNDSPWGALAWLAARAGLPDLQPAILVVSLLGLAITYAVAVLPRARTAEPVALIGLAIVTTMVWTRLYSPQFSLWVLPFFAVLGLRMRLFALLSLGDALVFVSIYPISIPTWQPDDPLLVVLRAVLFIGVAIRLAALIGVWRALRDMTPAPA